MYVRSWVGSRSWPVEVRVTCDVLKHPLTVDARYFRELRGVPVDTQLRSHMLFSENWAHYASLVDAATLYHTGTCAVDGST